MNDTIIVITGQLNANYTDRLIESYKNISNKLISTWRNTPSELIEKLKKANPLVKFSSDFIIGYPGETQKDFEETLNLLTEVKFINTYSFIFSPRPGTPASKEKIMKEEIARERLMIFQKKAQEIKLTYRKTLFNQTSKVLFENKSKDKNQFFGRDEFQNSVVVKTEENLKGKIKDVKIIDGNQNTLFGEIVPNIDKKEFAA